MKVCKGCKIEKGEVDFYTARGTRDGLHGKCKECVKARQREVYAITRTAPRVPVQQRDETKEWVFRANLNGGAVSAYFSGPLTLAQAERVRRIIEAHTVEEPLKALPCPQAASASERTTR